MGAATVLTNVGRGLITARLAATSGIAAVLAPYMGFGTNSSHTAAVTDTALATEVVAGSGSGQVPGYTRASVTGSQQTTSVTNDTYQEQGTLSNNNGSGVTIYEVATFDASTSGNMLLYATFAAGVPLVGTDTLTVDLSVQFE